MLGTPILDISPDRERYQRIPIWRDDLRCLRDIGISQIGIHDMDANYQVSRAAHRYHYHLLPIDCAVTFRILEGEQERAGTINAQDCWQCPQHLPYAFKIADAATSGHAIWWSLEKDSLSRPLKTERILRFNEIHTRIIQLVLWIQKDISLHTSQGNQSVAHSARALSAYLKTTCIDSLHFHEIQKQDLLQPLWEAVYQQPHLPWTLDDLADRCHMSRYQLTRLMKKTHQCTPIAMLTKIRLQHAEEYLTESNLTLNDIAQKLGYSTAFALSKSFKNLYGISPRAFRKQHQNSIS